ncbi:putative disease resistance protein [Vitis vinifera]|uniref:Putative disease resistance protein n=1 Tax=Vitis vinifera TaxID=29760 RepID=A0A438FTA3_VITVI|nr:putative disease resistance protein [Vitis vinifera]
MSVPSLGGLSLLEVLCIQGMGKVKSIGAEFYGECINPFASLKELRFEDIPKWESWSHSNSIKEDLDVSECPELVCGLPKLASLHELNLQECDEAMLRGSLVALERLVIGDCGGLTCLWEEQGLACNLKSLVVQQCAKLEKLPNELQSLMSLENLEIIGCPKLESFPEMSLPPKLRFLEVYNCEGLKWLPHNYNSCALEHLRIEKCPSLICFPHDKLPTTLKELFIGHCEKVESLPEGMIHRNSTLSTNTCLEKLTIPVGELPSTLKHLEIWGCRNLKSMSEKMWPSNTDLEYLELQGCPNLRTLPNALIASRCENLKSLPQQMRNLKSLQQLKIYQCPRVESFPEEGLAPNLTSLEIGDCKNLKTPISEWGLHALTSLSRLTIWNMYLPMVSFSNEECLLPTSLTNLDISRMRSLASLALQNLISLQSYISHTVRKLCSLGLLPATLGRLEIRNCPILKERYCAIFWKGNWPILASVWVQDCEKLKTVPVSK